jgi:hypothetical protein
MNMEEIETYGSVQRWLGRLAPSTSKVNKVIFNTFMGYVRENGGRFKDYTPDMLIEYQQNAGNGERYDLVDLLQDYVTQMEGASYAYKKKSRSVLRSFFLHNRAELPRDPSFIIRSDKEKVRGDLEIEEVRDMILSSNKVYRAIFLSMFQGAMDLSSFEYWNLNGYDQLVEQMKEGKEIIKIELPGRKVMRNVTPYHTWIGSDAVQAIKDYFDDRPDKTDAIFFNQHEDPVTKHSVTFYWLRHLDMIDLIDRKENGKTSNRYGKSVHELRDVFRTQWEKSPAKASVAEYMMGHVVDPLEYNKAFKDEDWTLSEYRKALPMLQIMSRPEPYGQVEKTELERLRRENDELRKKLEAQEEEFMTRLEKLEKIVMSKVSENGS